MKHLATLSLLLWAAAATLAQTPTVLTPPEGEPYTISSTSPAATTAATATPPTYQWFRNDVVIAGATSADYTVPATDAHGFRVKFKRMASVTGCAGLNNGFSNEVIVSFGGDWQTMTVGTTVWAGANLNGFRYFADKPDVYTVLFQWGSTTQWSPLNPAAGVAITGWNTTPAAATEWADASSPCPTGWKLPTKAQFDALIAAGSTWAAANSARGNAVAGRFFGSRHAACKLPDDMAGCIFFSALGYRGNANGALNYQGVTAYYWSKERNGANDAWAMQIETGITIANPKTFGFAIRCVK